MMTNEQFGQKFTLAQWKQVVGHQADFMKYQVEKGQWLWYIKAKVLAGHKVIKNKHEETIWIPLCSHNMDLELWYRGAWMRIVEIADYRWQAGLIVERARPWGNGENNFKESLLVSMAFKQLHGDPKLRLNNEFLMHEQLNNELIQEIMRSEKDFLAGIERE